MFKLARWIWEDLTWFGRLTIWLPITVLTYAVLPAFMLAAIFAYFMDEFVRRQVERRAWLGKEVHIFFRKK